LGQKKDTLTKAIKNCPLSRILTIQLIEFLNIFLELLEHTSQDKVNHPLKVHSFSN